MEIILQSTITCPNCGHKKEETMPTDACQYFYECENANKFLNQNKETVVFIVVTEVFLVHQFSRTKNVADGQKTEEQLKVFLFGCFINVTIQKDHRSYNSYHLPNTATPLTATFL